MKIGIIGAMDVEIKKFIEILNLKNIGKDIYYKKIDNKEIFLVKSGIGKVNSAAITQNLIDIYKVDLIINTGCAGSLLEEVKVLDVVISSYVTYHDFEPLRIMEFSVPDKGSPKASDELIKIAKEECDKLNLKSFVKPIASGDCFVTNEKQRDMIKEKTNAFAVDMESGSIGHIARKNEIPFVAIRTISDFADGVEEFEEKAGNISGEIVKYIIERI
ncbi:MAG: 5'-methylthioadenosine/S-adenosylhomocysteine nucleosidase [Bacilli bacterium]